MDGKIFEIVKKHIDEYDYMELLSSCGCPKDEFDIESEHISRLINPESDTGEIAEIIAKTFEKYFGNPENPKKFLEIAEKIDRKSVV